MKPNFLFIGPDKTGSSWLYQILRGHPECHVPELKDIYFFDRFYARGLDWYLSLFDSAAPGARAVGELSHDYLFSPAAAERIAKEPVEKIAEDFWARGIKDRHGRLWGKQRPKPYSRYRSPYQQFYRAARWFHRMKRKGLLPPPYDSLALLIGQRHFDVNDTCKS